MGSDAGSVSGDEETDSPNVEKGKKFKLVKTHNKLETVKSVSCDDNLSKSGNSP
jgi:hypothetical protein